MNRAIESRIFFFCIAWVVFLFSVDLSAQDEQRQSELGAQQKLVERMMTELESQFTSRAEKLREKEPDRAKRLIEAYQKAKETLITRKMAEVRQLLDAGKLDEAKAGIDVVIQRINDLVKLLLNTKEEKLDKQEQIATFEKWKRAIQDLRKDQTSQRKETGKVANKDQELKKLDGQIKKLDNLIKQQTDLIDETKDARGAGLRALDKIADKQFELRKETESLVKDVAGDEGGQGEPGEQNSQNSEQDPNGSGRPGGEQQSGEQQSGEQQSGEQQSGQQQSGQQQSGQQQSGQQQSGQQQSGQQQSGQQQSGQQQSGQQQSGQQQQQDQAPQPGQQPLQQAAKSQEKAEEDLGSGKPQDAKRQQEQALADMEKARSELKKERRRLASLPPEAMEEMAREQRRTRDKAMDMVEQMAKTPAQDESGGEQAGGDQQQSQQPGQDAMQQASEAMENASQDLDEQDAQKAERKQRDAEQKLDEALEEIEERLNQLRDETREEKLRRLEGRFAEMLERQRSISAMTVEIEDKKINLGKLQRRDQLVVLRLATEEFEIGELGRQAYDLLLEDGTSDVFPELVQELIEGLQNAGQLLQDERTDQLTQLMQNEIESTLLDLLEALKESQEKNDQDGGGGGGGGGGDQPLLKRSAELKMLKSAQQRLNRKTRQLDNIKGSQSQPDATLEQEISGLSDLQAKLQEMAEKIMEKDQQ